MLAIPIVGRKDNIDFNLLPTPCEKRNRYVLPRRTVGCANELLGQDFLAVDED